MHSILTGFALFFLFSSFFYFSGGYVFIFHLRQQQVRQEMKMRIKQGVPEGELILLKITRSEEENSPAFQRIHEREFRYHGQMYDIVRQEQHSDTAWYYCVSDDQETVLFTHLDEQVARTMNSNPDQQRQQTQLQRFLQSLFFSSSGLNPQFHNSLPQFFAAYAFQVKAWHSTPEPPPPQV